MVLIPKAVSARSDGEDRSKIVVVDGNRECFFLCVALDEKRAKDPLKISHWYFLSRGASFLKRHIRSEVLIKGTASLASRSMIDLDSVFILSREVFSRNPTQRSAFGYSFNRL